MRYLFEGKPALFYSVDHNGNYLIKRHAEDTTPEIYPTRDAFEKRIGQLMDEDITVFTLSAFQLGLFKGYIVKSLDS